MSVLWVGVATTVVTTAASITASKKRQKAQSEAMKEAAYVEGSAPIIPTSNQLEIETIGDAPSGAEGAAPDFREALEGSYGGGMYDTQDFRNQQQIPPELEALLMQQQQPAAQEPTNVQFSSSGGPVGLPQDVYHFSVPKISQMQMDQDPGVRNVGNAMMAQMEANPGMGMVGASAAEIDQMAAGGPVRPKKYQDGSDGGLRGYLSMDEMPEDATEYDKQMQRELIATELGRNNNIVELLDLYNSTAPSKESIFSEEIQYVEDPETGDIIPTMRGYMSPLTGSSREFYQSLQDVEQSTQSGRALTDRDREMLGLPMATGGPVQPRRYADGSDGGLDIFAMLDQTAAAEGRPTGGDMEREYLLETMDTSSEDPFSLEKIKEEMRIKEAEERSAQFLEQEGPLRRPTTFSKEDAQRLADAGPYEPSTLEQLLNRLGTRVQKKGFGIGRRFDQGPLEKLIEARREQKTSVPPVLGPR